MTEHSANARPVTTGGPTRLLVSLHSTVASETVLPVGVALATRFDVPLAVVDCVVAPSQVEEERHWVDQRLAADGLAIEGPECVHATHGVVGDLLATAAEVPGTVLCTAAHGRSSVVELVLGSVTHDVIVASPSPVLVVGPRSRVPTSFATIQACYDGSPTSARTVGVAADWARRLGATLWITQVVEPVAPDPATVPGSDVVEGAAVGRLGGDLRATGLDAQWDVLHGHHPADSLAEWAARHRPALLVVGSHGRSGFDRKGLGSVVGRLIHEAPCPLLVVGPSVT
jgi:nucleotide-binding universal stress UspA family protein